LAEHDKTVDLWTVRLANKACPRRAQSHPPPSSTYPPWCRPTPAWVAMRLATPRPAAPRALLLCLAKSPAQTPRQLPDRAQKRYNGGGLHAKDNKKGGGGGNKLHWPADYWAEQLDGHGHRAERLDCQIVTKLDISRWENNLAVLFPSGY
jgi:hypothetical protein